MPQMVPMMWLTSMLFFIITMIIMMILHYFLIQPMPSYTNFTINTNSINWKW